MYFDNKILVCSSYPESPAVWILVIPVILMVVHKVDV